MTTAVIKQALCLSKGFTKAKSSIKPLVPSESDSSLTGTIYTLDSGSVHVEDFKTTPTGVQDMPTIPSSDKAHALVTPVFLSSTSTRPITMVNYVNLNKRK